MRERERAPIPEVPSSFLLAEKIFFSLSCLSLLLFGGASVCRVSYKVPTLLLLLVVLM